MKLLICDDDVSVIDVIQSQIDLKGLGIGTVLRAYNGEMAKTIISEDEPELILCDIGMPTCDGTEVLKFIHQNRLDCEFCFLTCYEDFKYAQTAIQYGASGYVTKPFELEELERELVRMKTAYETRHGEDERQARQDSVLNSVFRQLCDGACGTNPDSVGALLRQNRITYAPDSRWFLAASSCDMTDAAMEGWNAELLAYSARRLHDEILVEYIGNAYTLLNFDARYIRNYCFVPAENCTKKELLSRCGKLISLCREHFSLTPTFVVSDEFSLYNASSVRSELALELRRLRNYPGRLFENGRVSRNEADDAGLNGEQILWYLKNNDAEGFRSYITGAAENAKRFADRLDLLRRDLVLAITQCLRNNGLDDSVLFGDSELMRLEHASTDSAGALCDFAFRFFDEASMLLRRQADSGDAILRVKNYIDEHFRENLDRNALANIAYITPNYLSKQFQMKVGKNLRKYMNDLRIAEAKKLLLSTDKSVSEIATTVGYDNFSYFSTIFRKYTGMSPVDWREMISKEGLQ